MANEFTGGGILNLIANPQVASAAPIANALSQFGDRRREDQRFAQQQELQQAQAQELQKQDQEALFFSNLSRINDPVQRSQTLQAGLQSGAIDQLDFDQVSSIPFEQQNAAIFDTLRVGGYDSLIPKVDESAAKTVSKIREETRAGLRGDLKTISKEAAEIKRNFTKVQNLAKNIKKGNRISATQGIVALVKLGDPGSVVSGNEVKGTLNAESPVAALFQLLTSKGMDAGIAESIATKIDPLNPDNINVADFLATADSLVSANVPSLQSRFSEAQALGQDNLSETGFNSIFSKGLTNRISGLTDLISTREAAPAANIPATETFTTQSGTTFTVQ